MTEIERETLTWNDFGVASRELARSVLQSGYDPDFVVAIARGGLLLAGSIAYALDTKACGSLNVEFYTGINTVLAEPVVLPPMMDQTALAGKKILLVDDVSDSGRTLKLVVSMLEKEGGEVRSVTLFSKPGTVMVPDYIWKETDRWIDFPWSVLPPVTVGDDVATADVLS